jgi:hypothetical protein
LHEECQGHEPGIASLGRHQERPSGHRYAVADVRGPGPGEEPSEVPPETTWSYGLNDATHNGCTLTTGRTWTTGISAMSVVREWAFGSWGELRGLNL